MYAGSTAFAELMVGLTAVVVVCSPFFTFFLSCNDSLWNEWDRCNSGGLKIINSVGNVGVTNSRGAGTEHVTLAHALVHTNCLYNRISLKNINPIADIKEVGETRSCADLSKSRTQSR